MEDFDAENALVLRLLSVPEPVTDPANASLLLERALFHFMRHTSLRRNKNLSVAEHELGLALQMADLIFQNDSHLRCLESQLSHDNDDEEENAGLVGGGGEEEISAALCVILDELLCFLDTSNSNSASDPPSLHVARVRSCVKLMRRLQLAKTTSTSTSITIYNNRCKTFRQSLPGVVSRAVTFLTKTLNAAPSVPCTKTQREVSRELLLLLQVHLSGCDFAGWLSLIIDTKTSREEFKNGILAYVRVAKLCGEQLSASVKKFLLAHVNLGGGLPFMNQSEDEAAGVDLSSSSSSPAAVSSSISSVTSAWFRADFSKSFGSVLASLFELIHVVFCQEIDFTSSSSKSFLGMSLLDDVQRESTIAAQKEIVIPTLQIVVLARRWWGSSDSSSTISSGLVSVLADKFDELLCCVSSSSSSSSSTQQQQLASVLMYDAVVKAQDNVAPSHPAASAASQPIGTAATDNNNNKRKQEASVARAIVKSQRSERLFRRLLGSMSAALQEEFDSASSSAHFVVESATLSLFEKWLIMMTPSAAAAAASENRTTMMPLPQCQSSLGFLMVVAVDAARRGDLLCLSGKQNNDDEDEDDEDDEEVNLQRFLEDRIVPLLDDPYQFASHHAACIIVMCVLRALLFSTPTTSRINNNQKSNSEGNNKKKKFIIDAVDSLLWGPAWEPLWEGVVLAQHPRSLAIHWDKCSAAQKRFRASINALESRVIATIGQGIAAQVAERFERTTRQQKQKQRRNNNNKRIVFVLPDAADRFLLLAVRELLSIASTEFDVQAVASEGAMTSLKMIATAFFSPPLFFLGDTTSSSSAAADEDGCNNNSSHLHALLRHCMPSVVDITVRALKCPTTAEEALENTRILLAATLLCTKQVFAAATTTENKTSQQQQQHQQRQQQSSRRKRSILIAELAPTILSIGDICGDLLRSCGVDEGSSGSRLYNNNDNDTDDTAGRGSFFSNTARHTLLQTAVAVADFACAAQREQDAEWFTAAASLLPKQKWKEGNIIRQLYKSGVLKKTPEPGQVKLFGFDEDWMDTEDFHAFAEPAVGKLHEVAIKLLASAVAALGSQYHQSFRSTSSSSLLARVADKDNDGSDDKRWNVFGPSSSDLTVSSSNTTRITRAASLAERCAAVRLCMVCLTSVSTLTPASYFEMASPPAAGEESTTTTLHQQTEEQEAQEEENTRNSMLLVATTASSSHHSGNSEQDSLLFLRPLRISRGHWTSVYKVFHALQSLMLSTRPSSSSSSSSSSSFSSPSKSNSAFRDVPSAVAFFHRFVDALATFKKIGCSVNTKKKNKNDTSTTTTTDASMTPMRSNNTRAVDAARIELRSCVDTLKRANLLADESIAKLPNAFRVLCNISKLFLLFRLQTEVLPLLALQWLVICNEKEPEVWTSLMMSSSDSSRNDEDEDGGAEHKKTKSRRASPSDVAVTVLPRTVLGKTFREDMLKLKSMCEIQNDPTEMEENEKELETEKTGEVEDENNSGGGGGGHADIARVARALKFVRL